MHSATIIIPLSKEEEALKKMIQEFPTTLSRQNSSCMARYWVQVCCEYRVYEDCGGQEMCLLMLQTVATETNVSGSGAAVIELST